MSNKENKSGFSLIELLVVIAVISILIAIAVPQYQRMVRRSRWTQAIAAVDALHKAVKTYYYAHGVWPDNETWSWANTNCNDINSYLRNMGLAFVEIPTQACDEFNYDLYCGDPVQVCDPAAAGSKCSIYVWRKQSPHVGCVVGDWGMRKNLQTDRLDTSSDPRYYP